MSAAAQALQSQQQQRRRRLVVGQLLAAKPNLRNLKNDEKPTAQQADSKGGGLKSVSDGTSTADPESARPCAAKRQTLAVLQRRYPAASYLNTCAGGRTARHGKGATAALRPCPARRWCQPLPWKERLQAPAPPAKPSTTKMNSASNLADHGPGPYAALRDLHGLSSLHNPPPLPPLDESEAAFLAAHTSYANDILDLNSFDDYGDSLLESTSPSRSPFGSFDELDQFADALSERWPRTGAFAQACGAPQRRKQPWDSVPQQPALRRPSPTAAPGLTSCVAAAASVPVASTSTQRPTTTLAPARAPAAQRSSTPNSLAENELLTIVSRNMTQIVDAVCWAQEPLARYLQGLQKKNVRAEKEAEKRVNAICDGIRNSLDSGAIRPKEVRSECKLIKQRLHMHTTMELRSEQKNLAAYGVHWPQQLYQQMHSKSLEELSREVDTVIPGWIVYSQGDGNPSASAWGILIVMAQTEESEELQKRGGGREEGQPRLGLYRKVLASAVAGAALLAGGSSSRQPLDPLVCALLCPVHFQLLTIELKVPTAVGADTLLSIASLYDIIYHLSLDPVSCTAQGPGIPEPCGAPRFTSSVVYDRVAKVILNAWDSLLRVGVVKGIMEKESDVDLNELIKDWAYVLIEEELKCMEGTGEARTEDRWDGKGNAPSEWEETLLDSFNLDLDLEEGIEVDRVVHGGRPPRAASQTSSSQLDHLIASLPEDITGCCIYDCFWKAWNGRVFEEWVAGGSKFFEDDIMSCMTRHGLLDLEYDNSAERRAMDVLRRTEEILEHFHLASRAAATGCTDNTTQAILQAIDLAEFRLMQRDVINRRRLMEWRETWLLPRSDEAAMVQQYEAGEEVYGPHMKVDIGALFPGLLATHPHSWGRLVEILNERGSEAAHALRFVARCAMLGLTALVGITVPVESLRLTPCVAAGYMRLMREDLEACDWNDDGDGADARSISERGIVKAINTFHVLLEVPPLRFHLTPLNGWTCAPPPSSSHLHAASGPWLPLNDPKRQEELGAILSDTVERILALPNHYNALTRCMALKGMEESARGTEHEERSAGNLQGALEEFAWVMWKHPLWLEADNLDEAEEGLQGDEDELGAAAWGAVAGAGTSVRQDGSGMGGGSGRLRQYSSSAVQQCAGAKWSPPPPPSAPSCQQNMKSAAHPHHHQQEPQKQQQQQRSQDQRAGVQSTEVSASSNAPQRPAQPQPSRPTSTRTEMPCLSSTSTSSEAVGTLLPLVSAGLDWRREEGRTPPGAAAVPAALSRPPVSMAAVGPERISLLMLILFHISDGMKGDVDATMTHKRLGFRVTICKALRAGSSRLIPQGKDAPCPAPSDQPAMILLSDIQPVVVPGRHDPKHTHAFEWATIVARTLQVTATSKWSDYMRSLQQALIKKKLGAVWLYGIGVEGVQRALLMIAKVQEEMRENGMNSHVSVSHIRLFGPSKDSSTVKGNRNLRRRSSGGGANQTNEPLIDCSQPGYELDCLMQGLQDLAHYEDLAGTSGCASGGHLRDFTTTRAKDKAIGHAAYLVDALSHTGSVLRQELTVEFRLTQCEHQRPDVPVLPRGEGTMQQRRLRDALLQRP